MGHTHRTAAMPTETRTVLAHTTPGTVLVNGIPKPIPSGWAHLPPGDAGLTRRVKSLGPSWTVEEKVGRRMFSRGVWAPAEHIDRARAELDAERADPAYAKRLDAARARRAKEQAAYVEDFRASVLTWLRFAPVHGALAARLADAVTAHATPVGSGTVARTERIPLDERARAAVLAWMRHQTTAYDDMRIARVKGERRRVRRALAGLSLERLDGYRRGLPAPADCPLAAALDDDADDRAEGEPAA